MFELNQLLARNRAGNRIKFRILIPLVLALGVLLATFAFAIWRVQQKELAKAADSEAQEIEQRLHAAENQKTAVLKTTIEAIMNDGQLTEAFRKRDRAALLERAEPLFGSLRNEHGITHFYFHLPDRTVLLRVHNPGVNGDKIDRYTLLEAERTGKVSVGIERGLTGIFTLRVVAPWRQDEQLLGYLELGVEFEKIVADVQNQLSEGVKFVVAVNKKFLDQEQWAAAAKREGRTDDWDQFPRMAVINKIAKPLPELAVSYLSAENLNPRASWQGGDFRLAFLPLTDVTGEDLGRVIVLQNVAGEIAETNRSIQFVVVLSLAVGAVVIIFFYFFLTGVENDLSDRTAKLKNEITEREVMAEIVRGVITTTNLDQLLRLAWRSISKVLYAENCFVALHDTTTDLVHFEFWIDKLDSVPPPQPVGRGHTRTSYVLRTGQPLRLTKEREAQLFEQGAIAKSGSASASWLGVPLRTPTRTIGVLAVQHYEKENAYSERDLEFLSSVADQIALAIERKQSEKALRDAEEKYRSIFEHSSEGIFQNTPEGGFLSANPALARMLGFDSPEELISGREDIKRQGYVDPALRDKFKETLEKNGFVIGFEYEVYRKDGAKIWVAESSRIVRDAEGRALYYEGSVQEITERKRAEAELENIQKELLEASRRGGMAEIATNVLHNVGNVLNSVNVSAGLIIESVKNSRASSLARVAVLLREHAHDLGAFMTSDPRGKHVPAHLAQLSKHLMADQEAIVSELDSLRRNVEHIKEIVAMQQTYATFGGVKEMINVVNLVEDSMRMNEGALSRHRVEVIREFKNVPPMNVEKNKILQILVNLLRNAKYACDESGRADKRLTVSVASGHGRVKISVVDNGVGISPENLTRIFSHGFTTWKNGHGFGLHGGALAAKEMGGSLTVHSEGSGQGAAFTLELPCENK